MAKVSDSLRLDFKEAVKPYQEKIKESLDYEKKVLAEIRSNSEGAEYKKINLCEEMIYVSTLYMAQNTLSLKILEVKNNDALNDARKVIYKALIYLEELVTNFIDVPYADLSKNQEKLINLNVKERYILIRKLGLSIRMLKDAFGDNSKWKWTFVEIEGRFATVAKNLIDMKAGVKVFFEPREEFYEETVLYIRLVQKLLDTSSNAYRDKYELSTRRLDDMKSAIKYLLALHKLNIAIGKSAEAEEVKKKAVVWKDKMNADQKAGSSN